MGTNSFFNQVLNDAFDQKESVNIKKIDSVSGGCINNAVKLTTEEGCYFLKWQDSELYYQMFQTEEKGLALLRKAGELSIPKTYKSGVIDSKAFLLMEFINPQPQVSDYWKDFGRSLANLHKKCKNKQFGLEYDNYIGSLPQYNHFHNDWVDFFVNQRLEPQLKLAADSRLVDSVFTKKYRTFYNKLENLLPNENPSLLHGDLWSGNVICGNNGKVCLIDPAIYYGNREMELSFTQMFGGFPSIFYNEYQSVYPTEKNFNERVGIHNIYPYMVHVNLFGTSYLSGVESVLKKYL